MVWLSFTTVPPRMGRAYNVVKNVLKHVKGDFILVLNVPKRYKRWPLFMAEIDVNVLRLKSIRDPRFILNIVEEDLGPITKLVPTLSIVRGAPDVLVIFDDNEYHYEAFNDIALMQKQYTDRSFTYWAYDYKGITVPQGVDLVSFWIPHLEGFEDYYTQTRKTRSCFFVDDLVIGNFLRLKGIEIEQLDRKWDYVFIPEANDTGLNQLKGEFSRKRSMEACLKEIEGITNVP